MGIFLNELGLAAKRSRRSVSLVLTSTALIATAVGGSTATFAVLDAVLFKPLPVADEAALVAIHAVRADTPRGPLPLPFFIELKSRSKAFSGVVAYFQWSANLTELGDAERLQGMRVSGDYLQVLGTGVALGRPMTVNDAGPHSAPVAVITDGLWKRRFGASASAVGQRVKLDGEVFEIVGVLPAGFPLPLRDAEILAPWRPEADPRRTNPRLGFMRLIGRLAPGVTRQQAIEEVASVIDAYVERYPQTRTAMQDAHVAGFREDLTGNPGSALWFLAAAMGLVLGIAAANLGGLLLAHAVRRAPEFAARRALGATAHRIRSQVAAETLILALLGLAAGLLVARVLLTAMVLGSGTAFLRVVHISIDLRSVLFAALVTGVITAVAALVPGYRIARAMTDRAGAHRWSTARARRARAFLVTAEIALSVLLLVAAGLLIRSFIAVQRVNLGFDPAQVFTVRLSLPRPQYPTTASLARFTDALFERLRTSPHVTTVAAANVVPMNSYLATSGIRPPGTESSEEAAWPEAHYRMVSPDYFSAMSIQILSGRGFDAADRAGALPVVVISEALARRYWPSRQPLGAELLLRDDAGKARAVQIVGIVSNVRHLGPELPAPHEVYVPLAQVPDATSVWLATNMYLVVKTSGDPRRLANQIGREIAAIDRTVASSWVRTMDTWVESATQARRFNLRLMVAFALTALLLAVVGVYAVTAEGVAARERELGIRAALGATDAQIRASVLRDGMVPIGFGIAAGVLAALGASRLIAAFLYGIETHDPLTFAAAPALLAIVGALAVYTPLRTLLKIDPIAALRAE